MPPSDTVGEQRAIGHAVVLPEQLVSSSVTQVSATQPADETEHGHEQLFAVEPEQMHGQCCQMENCPDEALQGQCCELTCLMISNVEAIYEDKAIDQQLVSIAPNEPVFQLIEVTPLLSYMKRNSDGMIAAAYIGFNNKTKAKQWSEWLSLTHNVATRL